MRWFLYAAAAVFSTTGVFNAALFVTEYASTGTALAMGASWAGVYLCLQEATNR